MQRWPSRIAGEQQVAQPAARYEVVSPYHELRCGVCGRVACVDEETAGRMNEAIAAGLDSPFLCEICEVYDDLSYKS